MKTVKIILNCLFWAFIVFLVLCAVNVSFIERAVCGETIVMFSLYLFMISFVVVLRYMKNLHNG